MEELHRLDGVAYVRFASVYRQFKDMESDFRSDYSSILLREGAFNTVSDGVTVYIRSRESDGELRGIIVQERQRFRVRERRVLRYYARTIEHLLVTPGRTH